MLHYNQLAFLHLKHSITKRFIKSRAVEQLIFLIILLMVLIF